MAISTDKTMSDLPSFGDSEAVEEVKQQGRQLIPWLPDPYTCDHCGSLCKADTQYVESQCYIMDVWQCPNEDCGARYFRDE